MLLGCLESTDFSVLYDENEPADYNVKVLNAYIIFCVDNIVPNKIVKCYGNNKPWITKDLKDLLNKKKKCLANKDRNELKSVQKEIKTQIRVCKSNYRLKIESMCKSDSKAAWRGLKQLTGMTKTAISHDVADTLQFCNELNTYYTRFDKYDFALERSCICQFHRNKAQIEPSIVIDVDDVIRSLKCVKLGKAPGPDRIAANVVKLCSEPLAGILCKIYQQSITSGEIPVIWKTSEIVPVPKKSPPKCNNDFRPVALTSIFMKCFEKIVKKIIIDQVKDHTDPLQFAYTTNRCVEDATLSLIDYVLKHVDKPNSADYKHFVKILFVDFSSAFNTIQPHLMMQKLQNMNLNSQIILWVNNFLTNRPQYVRFMDSHSSTLVTNTGAPQGCVLSPLLFTLYTADCRCTSENCKLFKYADDTALVSQCINEDMYYQNEVLLFTEWCKNNYLELNVSKTKQMIIDFRSTPETNIPLYINGIIVEDVTTYKYLGTIIDNSFTFSNNADAVYKKVNSRLYFIRQLRYLKVENKIIEMFYNAILQSVISFSITCWYGNCTNTSKSKITRVINSCKRLGIKATSLLDIYKKCTIQRYRSIYKDNIHPLHSCYQMLPSGKRLRSAKCRTARYSRSFVPSSIRIVNDANISIIRK